MNRTQLYPIDQSGIDGRSKLSEGCIELNGDWRLEWYEAQNPVTGGPLHRPIMTNGQCRVTALLLPGPLAHRFKYQEAWGELLLDFEFAAKLVGGIDATTYQVFLSHALDQRPEYWTGSSRDDPLLNRLMSNIRQALCLLRSGPTETTRIRTVEFVLSLWSRWQTLSDYRSTEIIR
jgi:hypothetical protein